MASRNNLLPSEFSATDVVFRGLQNDFDHLDHRADPASHRRVAALAIQRGMGLWSRRSAGYHPHHHRDLSIAWQDLAGLSAQRVRVLVRDEAPAIQCDPKKAAPHLDRADRHPGALRWD